MICLLYVKAHGASSKARQTCNSNRQLMYASATACIHVLTNMCYQAAMTVRRHLLFAIQSATKW